MSDKVFGSQLRKQIIFSVMSLVFVSFVFQLLKMQIIEHKSYEKKSTNNSIKRNVVKAPRGIFFDRNYSVLLSNKPSYTVQIIPAIYDASKERLVEQVLEFDSNYVSNLLYKKRFYSKHLPRVIKRNVPLEQIIWFEEHQDEFPGVKISVEMQRDYSFGINGSHLFGYLREINAEQLKAKKDIYNMGDFIGINGIERIYEESLRGENGYQYILVDSRRKTIGKYLEGENDEQPLKGNDLLLTIDYNTQKVAEKAFAKYKGSLIAIEPSTGEILAFVSAPQYNLEDFASVTSRKAVVELSQDENKPLFNRASKSIYPPGSTFKMISSLAALEENIINKNHSVNCQGGYQYGNRFFKCTHVHNWTNLNGSIEQSCNTYYYQLILEIGLDRWAEYSRKFGFGRKTGFDVGNESAGIVPDTEYYNRVYGKNKWGKGTLLSLGIGQGELSVTTLQLAQYTALLANFGKTKTPHIVKAYLKGQQNIVAPLSYKDVIVDVKKENLDIIRKGMYNVVHADEGTARNINLPNIEIAGKTGTSQNPHGKDHAVFMGFAPFDNPKIAVVVLVENVGYGSTFAAPIARDVIKTYLEQVVYDNIDM
ncbi:MAG: penicillin-binding protein 2 [Ignavibacteriae bacterium]|nr:penicillin-binding protein 2 [Ignavibacteriota bacterium]